MVINNYYLVRIGAFEAKTNPPLIIDADAPLATAIAPESLKPIARWHTERLQMDRRIKHAEFPARQPLNVLRQFPGKPTLPDGLGFLVTETPDHGRNTNGSRY